MGRLTSPYDPSLIQMLYIWLTLSPYLAHPIYNTLYTSIWLTLYTIPYIHIWLTLYTTPYIRVSDSPYIQHPIYIFGSPYICECTRIWLTLYTTYLAHPIYNTLHTSVFTCWGHHWTNKLWYTTMCSFTNVGQQSGMNRVNKNRTCIYICIVFLAGELSYL